MVKSKRKKQERRISDCAWNHGSLEWLKEVIIWGLMYFF